MYKDKNLELLYNVLIYLRHRLKKIDKESSDLLDVVHNIPSLLDGEREINDEILTRELLDYEEKYLDGQPRYSKIIK